MTEANIVALLPTPEEIGGRIYHRGRDDFFYNAGIREEDGLNWQNKKHYVLEDGGKYIMDFPEEIQACKHGISISKEDLTECPDQDWQIVIDIFTANKKYNRKIYKGTFAIKVSKALEWAAQCGYASARWRGHILVVPLVLWNKIRDGETEEQISGQRRLI